MSNPDPNSRNAALALISRINRWGLAASVAATGAFALLAAHAFPGHSRSTNSGASSTAITAQPASSDDGTSNEGGAYSDDGGSVGSLQQPFSTPSASSSGATSSSGSVVSGGS